MKQDKGNLYSIEEEEVDSVRGREEILEEVLSPAELLTPTEDMGPDEGEPEGEGQMIEESFVKEMEDEALKWNGERRREPREEDEFQERSAWKILMEMMGNPVNGVKQLKRSNLSIDQIGKQCYYPLAILAGVTKFAAIIYDGDDSYGGLTIEGLGVFLSFFFGFYTVLQCVRFFLPQDLRTVLDSRFGRAYIMMNMCTLPLFYILNNLIPMLEPVMFFFPLWTIYILSKSVRLFKIAKDGELRMWLTLGVLVIGSPIFWDWILGLII